MLGIVEQSRFKSESSSKHEPDRSGLQSIRSERRLGVCQLFVMSICRTRLR